MGPRDLGDLFGVDAGAVRVQRALFVFAGLLVSNAVWLLWSPDLLPFGTGPWDLGISFLGVASPWFWLADASGALLFATICVAAFRIAPSTIVAVAVVVVVYGPLRAMAEIGAVAGVMESEAVLSALWPRGAISQGLWAALVLGCLAAALKWVRHKWVAITVGFWLGDSIHRLAVNALDRSLGIGWEGDSLERHVLDAIGFLAEWKRLEPHAPSVSLGLPVEGGYLLLGMVPAALFGAVVVGCWRLTWERVAQEEPPARRISREFYLGTFAVCGGVPMLLIGVALSSDWGPSEQLATLLLTAGLGGLLFAFGATVLLLLTYRMWDSIQGKHSRTSPGRAVGFLFVPLFGFYWVVQAYWGFAKDYNSLVDDLESDQARKLNARWFLAFAVLSLLGVIPFVNAVTWPIWYVNGLFVVSEICDAVNRLPGGEPSVSGSA